MEFIVLASVFEIFHNKKYSFSWFLMLFLDSLFWMFVIKLRAEAFLPLNQGKLWEWSGS